MQIVSCWRTEEFLPRHGGFGFVAFPGPKIGTWGTHHSYHSKVGHPPRQGRFGFVAFPGPEEGTWGTRLSAHRASAGQLCPGFFPRDLCEICRRFLQRHALIPAHEPLAFQAKPEAYRLYELLALLRSQIVPDVSGKSRPNAIQIQLGSLRGADGDGCALPCDLFKKCLQPRTTPSPFNCKEPSSFIGDI